MATAAERALAAADFLGLAGRIERIETADAERHRDGRSLLRWRSVYAAEIRDSLNRRAELLDPLSGPEVSFDRLTAWIEEARFLLSVTGVDW